MDVKHFEDCEQLFFSVGRCYAVEALLQFFGMEKMTDKPTRNVPPYHLISTQKYKKEYWDKMLTKFVDKYLIEPFVNHCDPATSQQQQSTMPTQPRRSSEPVLPQLSTMPTQPRRSSQPVLPQLSAMPTHLRAGAHTVLL